MCLAGCQVSPQWIFKFYYFESVLGEKNNQLALIRDNEREGESWKRMFGKLEGGRAEVLEVKGESEMSKERGGAHGGMCGGAGRKERRGEGSGMDDSLVKWMTDLLFIQPPTESEAAKEEEEEEEGHRSECQT